jgi:hypothetical protein
VGTVELFPKEIIISEARQVAWAILDLAKMYLWRFYYGCLKENWKGTSIAYTDTDSIVCTIPTKNFVEEAQAWNRGPQSKILGGFDLKNLGVKTEENGQLGSVKSEMGTNIIREGVFLQSKTYALDTVEPTEPEERPVKGKGIPKHVLAKYSFEHYKKMLYEPERFKQDFYTMSVHKLKSVTKQITKKTISCENDKSFIWRNDAGEYCSRPLGHRSNEVSRQEMN